MGEALFWRGSKISGGWEFGCGFASNHVYVQGHVMVGGGGGGNGNESILSYPHRPFLSIRRACFKSPFLHPNAL
jgi:hypothetical protein